MEREFELNGTAEDRECFQYCAYGKTGSNKKVWDNGVLDQGRADGLTLDDFVGLKEAKKAHLSRAYLDGRRTVLRPCRECPCDTWCLATEDSPLCTPASSQPRARAALVHHNVLPQLEQPHAWAG
jgi:hypothetical protein